MSSEFHEDVLGHEGPTLINLRIDASRFELGVNAPGLLFVELQLRTSLHLQDGCDYGALRSLIEGFGVTAFCGHEPPRRIMAHVSAGEVAPYVSIGVGPPSMYMSRLRFETSAPETFRELCDRTMNPHGREDYLVALVPRMNTEAMHHRHPLELHMVAPTLDSLPARPKYRIEYVLSAPKDVD